MAKYLLLSIFSLLIYSTTTAQTEHLNCGTETPESAHQLMDDYYQSDIKFKQDSTLYLPITAHIFRRSNGTGGLTVTQLFEAIDAMNVFYKNADIQFFVCGEINFIDNTTYYDFKKSHESYIGSTYDVKNSINIYFANSVTSAANQALCGYAYYPGGPDRILMANSCATNGSTLSHEVGHFFSLMHTHGSSNTRLTTEYVNGTNCLTGGDRICDTPADPQLSTSNVSTSCFYFGNTTDSNGDKFEPDPANIMSYSRKSCRTLFTPQQYDVIKFTSRTVRNYFECTGGLEIAQLPATEICSGSETDIVFYSDHTFSPLNVFSVEMSDQHGNFDNATTIGSITGNTTGSIPVEFPKLADTKSGYKLRVIATNPSMEGNVYENDLTLFAIPDIAIEDIELCETDTYNLAAAFEDKANTTGNVSFWSDTTATTTVPNPETIQSSGTYYIKKVTDQGSCEAIAEVDVDFKPSPPMPVVSVEGDLLVSSASAGNQWHNLDGPIAGATHQTLQPPYNSFYWVVVHTDVCTSEPSEQQQYYLTEKSAPLHPNPAREVLYLNHKPANSNAIYRIIDIRGRTVITGELAQATQQQFNLYTLGRGLYVLEISDDGAITRTKFVKM